MTTTKQFDRLSRLTSISSAIGSSAIGYSYQYNNANQRTRATLIDGSYWLYEYDSLGQVKAGRKYWADGRPVAGQQFEYGFDDIGNRTSTRAGGDQNGWNLRKADYTPNDLNQHTTRTVPPYVEITGVSFATNTVKVSGETAYRKAEYFWKELQVDNGSLPVWTNITVTATNETPVTGNLYVPKTPEQFGYDLDGNLTNDGRWAYTWDAENRLVEMLPSGTIPVPAAAKRKLDFSYDWQGRRIQKAASTWSGLAWSLVLSNRFVYDGWNLVAELNATNNALIRAYTWGLDLSGSLQGAGGVGGLLATCDPATNFVASDGNGNVVCLVGATTEAITAQYEYGPFGEVLRATGPMAKANPIRWSTKYTDDETDLVMYLRRPYSPSSGRWLSRDPIGEKGGLNLYGFLRNNSLNRIDPFGLSEKPTDETPQCCDNTCDKEGEKFLTGEAASVYLAGEYQLGDKDVIKQMDRAIKGLMKCARGPYAYAKEPGKISEATSVAVSKKLEDFQNGTKLYTVLIYNLCVKKRCKLFGQCSPMHWVPLKTGARLCKPTAAEAHPMQEDAFVDRETANAAVSRCQEEHAKEFEAP